MNINWKVRIKNPAFWIGIIPLIAILVQVVGEPFGLDVAKIVGVQDYLIATVNAAFGILAFLGVTADPTTAGLSDSTQALTYEIPKEE